MKEDDFRALITGASSGIGESFARGLRRRGERLVLVARRAERLASLVRELGGESLVAAIPLDLTRPDAGAQLEQELARRGLTVDLLVNNAGSGDTGPFHEQPLARITGMIELNARVMVELTRRFLPGMIARGRGRIVNVVSNAAFQPVPYLTVYAATKSLALSFTEALATEVRGTGVRVQALCPGPTATEFFEVARTGDSLLIRRVPRMTPDAVAACSLRALERGALRVIPGISNRLLAGLVRVLPGALVRRVAGELYRQRGG